MTLVRLLRTVINLLTCCGGLLLLLLLFVSSASGLLEPSGGGGQRPPPPATLLINNKPRHVHISYGNSPSEMFITWSTLLWMRDENERPAAAAIVEYGRRSSFIFENWAGGTTTKFTDFGPAKSTQYIHRAVLVGLEPNQKYGYRCGNNDSWSEIYSFRTMPASPDEWSPSLAIYGDLGTENAHSLRRIQKEVQEGRYDAIIHLGDFAYEMHSENGQVGDAFMEQIEPLAAFVPYMTCPGNHEFRRNFSHYKNRFTMPGAAEGMYYSWNMGPIHFISLSTEFYYFFGTYGIGCLISQYNWLEEDLKEANKPENRAIRPWIITYGHRPMYCSNNITDDCTNVADRVRVGAPTSNNNNELVYGLEELFMAYGVDLCLWAHEHSYERLFPLYNYSVVVNNGSGDDEPYLNPKALVHVTTGSAGCKERKDEFPKDDDLSSSPLPPPPWSAFRSTDYSYSRLRVLNRSHLQLEQVSDEQDGAVIDSFTLIREVHGPHVTLKCLDPS